jgi:hypothetical protein
MLAAAVMAVGMGAQAASPTPAAAATPLLVTDVRALSLDEQILFAALEGIVNRSSPHLYLEGLRYAQDFDVDPTAATWLHDTVPLGARSVAPNDLLMHFRSRVRGLVVWDPRLAVDTQNVATTIAGVDGVLPASPALAARLGRAPYRLPVIFDLRREAFASRAQAYDWALRRFGCCTRTHMLAWLGGARNGRAGQPGLRDLLVARRAFAFEADPEREPDLATRILDSFPSGTPVFGYPFFDDQLYATTGQAAGEPARRRRDLALGQVADPERGRDKPHRPRLLQTHRPAPALGRSPRADRPGEDLRRLRAHRRRQPGLQRAGASHSPLG